MIKIKDALAEDAICMSAILAEILVSWNSQRPSSPQHVVEHYIGSPDRIICSVAIEGAGEILGFQSLKIARDGNPYDLPTGWGIIGTYVVSDAVRKGVGKALFESSRAAALASGLTEIDATIGDKNETALAYYQAMGFETYRTKPGAICKRLVVR